MIVESVGIVFDRVSFISTNGVIVYHNYPLRRNCIETLNGTLILEYASSQLKNHNNHLCFLHYSSSTKDISSPIQESQIFRSTPSLFSLSIVNVQTTISTPNVSIIQTRFFV